MTKQILHSFEVIILRAGMTVLRDHAFNIWGGTSMRDRYLQHTAMLLIGNTTAWRGHMGS